MFNLLLYLLFATFSLGDLGRISFLDQQVNVYAYELLVISYLLIGIWMYQFRPIVTGWKKSKWFLAFVGVWTVSFALNVTQYNLQQNVIASLYMVRIVIYYLAFLHLRYHVDKNQKLRLVIDWSVIIFLCFTAVISVLQYLFYPNLCNLLYLGWDPHLYRMFGVFFDTSVAAAVYGMSFIYLLLRLIEEKKKQLSTLVLTTFYFIFSLMTFSRSLLLALGLILMIVFVRKKLFYCFIVTLLVGALFMCFVPKPFGEGVNLLRVFSIESRFASYQEGIRIWLQSPFFGIGYNHLREAKELLVPNDVGLISSHAGASLHSSFLIILATLGPLGVISLIGWMIQLAKNENMKFVLLLVALLSLTDNILLHPFILLFLLTLQLIV